MGSAVAEELMMVPALSESRVGGGPMGSVVAEELMMVPAPSESQARGGPVGLAVAEELMMAPASSKSRAWGVPMGSEGQDTKGQGPGRHHDRKGQIQPVWCYEVSSLTD